MATLRPPPPGATPPVRPTLVWLASYPKSGNTWLRLFLANYLLDRSEPFPINDLPKLTFADNVAEPYVKLSGRPIEALDEATVHALRPQVHRLLSTQGPDLILVKTHVALYVSNGIPSITVPATRATVYLVRNPFDVADSFAQHFGVGLDQAVDTLCSPNALLRGDPRRKLGQRIGDWGSHATRWADAAPLNPLVLRYEDLRRDPLGAFSAVVRHLGLPCDPPRVERAIGFAAFDEARRQEERVGFVEGSSKAERFFRAGQIGRGRDRLGEEQRGRLVAAHGEAMRRFGYLDADGRPVDHAVGLEPAS
ncbi:Sulfotransferase domain-containing protein [Tistlia consotensis]|uniref:Sulfotransferase domain-containing protein n=1 Tax=Tistlia consotensis USBA 355 TaxID=560819 RepID=A0A1Y6BIH1_9PROT|nr:sulfotransferase domain-containing protein [Tistlia consotensis]SMF09177.1 Sulfotransferase domain-containing protein [Tistlia consotensis USBA 355]SNR34769.1 Sulfotransferase domain-containing protein [Tistlia consotensis]